ncbi:hypothetical protein T01_10915 [Trichinella spiralis]|uniref:Uncharacterized protein n=1 Tax=Trichinella spiralis TaxID=6334 RepID=A0A0V0YXX5_TRISP|nr:hypothetical protein T01_10915 [Trichinella spiralis]
MSSKRKFSLDRLVVVHPRMQRKKLCLLLTENVSNKLFN